MIEEDKYKDFVSLIELARGPKASKLTSWENDFIDSMGEKIEEFGQDTFMSEKQWKVIERLERKLGIE